MGLETKPSNLDDSPTTSQTPEPPNASGGSELSENNNATVIDIPAYLHAIMNPASTTFPRLECPQPNLERYAYLGGSSGSLQHGQLPRYFFALDLHQCVDLLPRLIGSIVETMYFLGPQNCVLSIVEGRSDDGTFDILNQLHSSMQLLGTQGSLHSEIKKLSTPRYSILLQIERYQPSSQRRKSHREPCKAPQSSSERPYRTSGALRRGYYGHLLQRRGFVYGRYSRNNPSAEVPGSRSNVCHGLDIRWRQPDLL